MLHLTIAVLLFVESLSENCQEGPKRVRCFLLCLIMVEFLVCIYIYIKLYRNYIYIYIYIYMVTMNYSLV